jgi:hypothetical protein
MKTLGEMTFEEALPLYEALHNKKPLEYYVAGPDSWIDTAPTLAGLRPELAYRVKTITRAELLDRLEALPDPIGKMAADEIKALVKSLNSPSRGASDGWIEWYGGECPVDEGTPVEIEMRCGDKTRVAAEAGCFRWSHEGAKGDIIRYRVVKP